MTDNKLLDSGNQVGGASVVEPVRRVGMRDRDYWEIREICYDEGPVVVAHHWEKNVFLITDVASIVYRTMQPV